VICLLDGWWISDRRAHGSSVDLQLKKGLEPWTPLGEFVSETLLVDARPQAFRVPGADLMDLFWP
jgi:hypothetical protein